MVQNAQAIRVQLPWPEQRFVIRKKLTLRPQRLDGGWSLSIHKIFHKVAERGSAKVWKSAILVRLLFAFRLYSPEAGILWKFRSILALTPG
jgi:hypothetical protein